MNQGDYNQIAQGMQMSPNRRASIEKQIDERIVELDGLLGQVKGWKDEHRELSAAKAAILDARKLATP